MRKTLPIALVFDATPSGLYVPIVRQSAEQAGWSTDLYNDEAYALEDLGYTSVKAAVVILNNRKGATHFPGKELLRKAKDNDLPKAAITSMPEHVEPLLNMRLTDELIAKRDNTDFMVTQLAQWLIRLRGAPQNGSH